MEERPPIWRVAANILNKQSRTADKGGPPAWELGEGLTTPHCEKEYLLRNIYRQSFEPVLIIWNDLTNETATRDLVPGMLGACIGQVYVRQQPGSYLDINYI
jgi:hypothetical protein